MLSLESDSLAGDRLLVGLRHRLVGRWLRFTPDSYYPFRHLFSSTSNVGSGTHFEGGTHSLREIALNEGWATCPRTARSAVIPRDESSPGNRFCPASQRNAHINFFQLLRSDVKFRYSLGHYLDWRNESSVSPRRALPAAALLAPGWQRLGNGQGDRVAVTARPPRKSAALS